MKSADSVQKNNSSALCPAARAPLQLLQYLSEMRPTLERRKTTQEANVKKRAKYVQLGSPETIRAAHVAVRKSPTVYEESLFLRQNDYWIIRYHGQAAFFKSTRGLCCLAVLLSDPGREFHVTELLARHMAESTPVPANQRVTNGLHAGIPMLDARAKAEYRRRLNELRQDLIESERFNDLQRKTEVQNEIQAISDHLASAIGLGGSGRKSSSDAERARSAATKCIKKAVQKIGEAIPSLGYHLVARIKTGYFCSYNPHPDRPVAWKF